MYWLDIVILGIAVVSVVYGLRKGLVKEVFTILQILLPFLIAMRMSASGQKLIQPIVHNPTAATGVSFVTILLLTGVGVWILGSLSSKAIRFARFGLPDKILGGAFGIIKASLIAGIICIFLLTFLPHGDGYLQRSVLAPKALYVTHKTTALFPAHLRKKFSEKFEQIKAIWKKQKLRMEPSPQQVS